MIIRFNVFAGFSLRGGEEEKRRRGEKRRGEEQKRRRGDSFLVNNLESQIKAFKIINEKPISSSPFLLFPSSPLLPFSSSALFLLVGFRKITLPVRERDFLFGKFGICNLNLDFAVRAVAFLIDRLIGD